MPRIKINNLKKNEKITCEELNTILGGFGEINCITTQGLCSAGGTRNIAPVLDNSLIETTNFSYESLCTRGGTRGLSSQGGTIGELI